MYNQNSLKVFKDLSLEIKIDYKYKIDLSANTILKEEKINKALDFFEIKGFSSRLNQIAYIKNSITDSVKKGANPSNIALVLPDESFATLIQLFDNERYFNYAMGKSIKNTNLYQTAYAIFNYLSEDEIKNIENLTHLQIDKIFIDQEIKPYWNKKS